MKTYSTHPESIRALFNNIAPTYDLLNHLLSLGRDLYWRKTAVREFNGLNGWVLDIATGTGDVAIEITRQEGRRRNVVGVDFSEPMIRRAREKLTQKGLLRAIAIGQGDALFLPFRENTFHGAIIAFGLRNIAQKEQALSEMVRVVKPGGKAVVLEFTLPQKGLMKGIFPVYFRRVLPRIGGWISGDRSAYAYLPESVLQVPCAEEYEGLMKKTGLGHVVSRQLTGGVVSIVSGIKRDG